MDRATIHDARNELAVAIASIYAFLDGKLPATAENLTVCLDALKALDELLGRARTERRADDDLFTVVVERAPNATILVDQGGKMKLVNAQAEKLFGYQRDELLGQSIELLVPERFRTAHPALRERYEEAPIARPMGAGRDLYGRRRDGSEVPIEIALNPVKIDGAPHVLAAIVDITERKRAEELRLLHAGAQRESRFKSQFVATMSHELRTPLNVIVGAAELLSRMQLEESASSHVQTVNEAAEVLLSVVSSILDFSKIEAGKMELRPRPFSVARAVEGVADVLGQLAREKGLSIFAYVDPQIPALIGDADRLRQVLLNLAGNAVKFTEAGEVLLRAHHLTSSADEVVVRFEVSDTGIGIEPDVLERLFEPFVQADSSPSRRFGGTGLGLSISRHLVALMGGEIGVRTEPGAGSLFWFTIRGPRADESPASGGRTSPPATPAAEHINAPVLVAEDNVRLQRLLQLQFDELGVPVTFVSDGQAALEAVRGGTYSLVFMDCEMPVMDGMSAARAIRADEASSGCHVPIAAMTANAFVEDRDACLAAGMDDYLAKPIRLTDLRTMLRRWSGREFTNLEG